jgi:DNA-directed RNA polymerase subunit RPC12/RpoP
MSSEDRSGDEPVVDRADYDPDYDPDAPIVCEICGSRMFYTGACKIQCPNCGFKRDCSDP